MVKAQHQTIWVPASAAYQCCNLDHATVFSAPQFSSPENGEDGAHFTGLWWESDEFISDTLMLKQVLAGYNDPRPLQCHRPGPDPCC